MALVMALAGRFAPYGNRVAVPPQMARDGAAAYSANSYDDCVPASGDANEWFRHPMNIADTADPRIRYLGMSLDELLFNMDMYHLGTPAAGVNMVLFDAPSHGLNIYIDENNDLRWGGVLLINNWGVGVANKVNLQVWVRATTTPQIVQVMIDGVLMGTLSFPPGLAVTTVDIADAYAGIKTPGTLVLYTANHWIQDATGSKNNKWPGTINSGLMTPSGAGTYGAWAGDWTDVDETPANPADVITTFTDADIESWTLSNVAAGGAVIRGLAHLADCDRGVGDNTPPVRISLLRRVGGNDYFASEQDAEAQNAARVIAAWDEDSPDTAVAYTQVEIDAMEGGVKRTAGDATTQARCIAAHVEVFYGEPGDTPEVPSGRVHAYHY